MTTILLWDDDQSQSHIDMHDYLNSCGYDVESINTDSEAIAQVLQKPYSIVIFHLDKLDNIDPKKLFRRLRHLSPEVLIITLAEDGWNREQAPVIRMSDGTLLKSALPEHLHQSLVPFVG